MRYQTILTGWVVCVAVVSLASGEEVYEQAGDLAQAGNPPAPVRCEVLPVAGQQVAFSVDGDERTRWHFGAQYPRPFFFPLNAPRSPQASPPVSLTRMGHPGAENHDHHRSVWFAFHDVDGVNFWSDSGGTQVRQEHWYAYRDGDQEAVMASRLGWYDAEGRERMEQDLVAALIPGSDGEYALELQIDLRPPEGLSSVVLGKTNFGFLAVRVAASLSVHFGGGQLTNSDGAAGEAAIFGKPARWVDYSGPISVGVGGERQTEFAGITYFDHPENPRYPTHWHVREDGWMGAAFCLNNSYTLTDRETLRLRYLLLVHRGAYDADQAAAVHERFAARSGFDIRPAGRDEPHRQYVVQRSSGDAGSGG